MVVGGTRVVDPDPFFFSKSDPRFFLTNVFFADLDQEIFRKKRKWNCNQVFFFFLRVRFGFGSGSGFYSVGSATHALYRALIEKGKLNYFSLNSPPPSTLVEPSPGSSVQQK